MQVLGGNVRQRSLYQEPNAQRRVGSKVPRAKGVTFVSSAYQCFDTQGDDGEGEYRAA
jgi:hypothetical protein